MLQYQTTIKYILSVIIPTTILIQCYVAAPLTLQMWPVSVRLSTSVTGAEVFLPLGGWALLPALLLVLSACHLRHVHVSRSVQSLNPFTAPARTISGLKCPHTCLRTVYFPVLCQTNLLLILFWQKKIQMVKRERKKAQRFRILHYYRLFSSDRVKGLSWLIQWLYLDCYIHLL